MASPPTDEDREVEELVGRLAELGVSVVITSRPTRTAASSPQTQQAQRQLCVGTHDPAPSECLAPVVRGDRFPYDAVVALEAGLGEDVALLPCPAGPAWPGSAEQDFPASIQGAAGSRGWYVVWRVPGAEYLQGVHGVGGKAWHGLEARLPGRTYRYSDGTRLRGHLDSLPGEPRVRYTFAEAVAAYHEEQVHHGSRLWCYVFLW